MSRKWRTPPPPDTLPVGGAGGLRLAFRIAARMMIQARGRSILIAALIAIPILGLAGVDTVEASRDATPAETARLQLGSTQARLTMVSPPDKSLRQDPLDETRFQQDENTDGTPKVAAAGRHILAPRDVLSARARILGIRITSVNAKTKTGVGYFQAVEGDAWNRAFAGKWDVTGGRTPKNDHEIMVTSDSLTRFGVRLGQTITITEPRHATFTVVGTLRGASESSGDDVLFGRDGAFDGVLATADVKDSAFYLPNVRLSWSQVRALNAQGATVLSREVLLNPPPPSVASRFRTDVGNPIGVLFIALLGAFGLFEVCLLAGAAFAVGARRQQRALAVMASVGADRRALFRVMSFGGILLGLIGGVVGVAAGLAAARLAIPLLSDGNASRYPGFHIDVPVLLLIVAASMISGWAAAAIPARAASRVDVVGALRGTRRPPKTSARRPAVGVVLAMSGAVLTAAGGVVTIVAHQASILDQRVSTLGIVLLVAGPITMQLGAILIAPLLLRVTTRLLSRFGAGARLGSRDASRNPARTVPALAAVMSTVFVSSFVLCLLGGAQLLTIRDYLWTAPLHQARVSLYTSDDNNTAALHDSGAQVQRVMDRDLATTHARVISSAPDVNELGTTVADYTVPRVSGQPDGSYPFSAGDNNHIVIGGVADLTAIMGISPGSQSLATLSSGGVVAFSPRYVTDGRVTFDWKKAGTMLGDTSGKTLRTASLPATVQATAHPLDYGMFMLSSTADRIGIRHAPSSVIAPLDSAPTQAQLDAIRADLQVVDPGLFFQIESGPQAFAAVYSWGLLALTTLIALAASVIALSLARADGRRDEGVLISLGAAPRVQRAFGFWQAIVITGTGSAIGVALGLVPAAALDLPVAHSGHGYLPFAPPWLQLALIAIAMPLVIACGSWLVARRQRWSTQSVIR